MEPSCDDGREISHPAPFVSQVKDCEHRDGVEPTTANLQNWCSAIELPMRRSKDYLVPLQMGDSRLTPTRPVRTSVLGSVSPPTSFPALDTGRLLATRPCIK